MTKCYSFEYKQSTKGDNEPNNQCPKDGTIISLLTVVQQLKDKYQDKYADLEDLSFSEIDKY
jgi:hypothetical protein